jgi:hypothetical protein
MKRLLLCLLLAGCSPSPAPCHALITPYPYTADQEVEIVREHLLIEHEQLYRKQDGSFVPVQFPMMEPLFHEWVVTRAAENAE